MVPYWNSGFLMCQLNSWTSDLGFLMPSVWRKWLCIIMCEEYFSSDWYFACFIGRMWFGTSSIRICWRLRDNWLCFLSIVKVVLSLSTLSRRNRCIKWDTGHSFAFKSTLMYMMKLTVKVMTALLCSVLSSIEVIYLYMEVRMTLCIRLFFSWGKNLLT